MSLPPADFLFDCSDGTLQDLELAALNRAANDSKALKKLIDEWIESQATAMVAKWMRQNREALLSRRQVDIPPKRVEFLESEKAKKSA